MDMPTVPFKKQNRYIHILESFIVEPTDYFILERIISGRSDQSLKKYSATELRPIKNDNVIYVKIIY